MAKPDNATAAMSLHDVPADFKRRKRLWIYSSLWLNSAENPFASLSIQTLGYAERMLLDMEMKLSILAKDRGAKRERDLLLSECSAHSVLWIFGFYEVLRTIREAEIPQFSQLAEVFQKLETLRMPLAKHEVKKYQGAALVHYPTSCWDVEKGHVGWDVYDPRLQANHVICRTPLADEFLAIAAMEPAHLPPFPIGGQLGEFED